MEILPTDLKQRTVTVDAKKDFQRLDTVKVEVLTSMAKSTPPIGAPKVQVTPTATAAVRNWCLRVIFDYCSLYGKLLAMQPAICTNGPSLPKLIPVESMQIIPSTLLKKVLQLSMLGRLTPAMIALIYGMPLPCAKGLMN